MALNKVTQAAILVGGKGTRLAGISGGVPKPFISINGRPFIDRVLHRLSSYGITRVLMLASYNSAWITANYSSPSVDIEVVVVHEPAPSGTGGALFYAQEYFDDHFFLLNGDTFFDVNLNEMMSALAPDTAAVMALKHSNECFRYGAVKLEDGVIKKFAEKSATQEGLVNGGVYLLDRKQVMPWVSKECSLEIDVFPLLVDKALLGGCVSNGFFIDIGIPETLTLAGEILDTKIQS